MSFRTDGFTSSGEGIDAFHANVPLGSICSQGCGLPNLSPLPDGAVVLGIGVLSGVGAGDGNPHDLPPNTSVAGRDALWSANKPGTCGGEESINVWIPNPSGNDLTVQACLFGPDLSAGEQIIESVLASASFSGP